jgi:hypothetical protein
MAATIQHIELPKKPRALDSSSSKQVVSQNLLADSGFTGITQNENTSSFAHGSSAWSTGAGWTIGITTDNVASCDGTQSAESYLQNADTDLTDPENKFWEITYSITARSAGTVRAMIGGYGPVTASQSAVDTYTEIVGPVDSRSVNQLYFEASTDFVGSVDNILVKSVENFSNNNHGKIYSGRALEFDGVTDSLTVSTDVDTEMPHMIKSGTFTVACWIKQNSSKDQTAWYAVHTDNNTSRLGLGFGDNGEVAFVKYDNVENYIYAGNTAANPVNINTWYRAVCVMTSGSQKMYLNGVELTGTVIGAGHQLGSTETKKFIIGEKDNVHFDGAISDFQSWDAAWSAADVAYDFANPESLALNASGTALTEGNLKLWYPMQDGHRGQQSYILDGANTGLADTIVTNGTFTGITQGESTTGSEWTTEADWTISGGKASVDCATSKQISQSIPLVSGGSYKITGTVEDYVEGTLQVQFGNSQVLGPSPQKNGPFTMYANSTVGTESLRIYGMNTSKFSIADISVQPINDKHHATTVFLGDELIASDPADNRTFDNDTGNWVAHDTSGSDVAISNNSNKLRVVTTTDNEIEGVKLPIVHVGNGSTTSIVAGRTYRVSANLDWISGGFSPPFIYVGVGGALVTAFQIDASDAVYTKDITAINDTGDLLFYTSNNIARIFDIDNVSVKEVGVATGWTDADQQLDIAQPALQSYNELAWFDGTTAGKVTCGSDTTIDNVFAGGGTFSGWVYPVHSAGAPLTRRIADKSKWLIYYHDETSTEAYVSFQHIATSGGTNSTTRTAARDLKIGKWHHVAATFNKNSMGTNAVIYINGVSVATTDNVGDGTAGDDSTDTMFIANNSAGNRGLHGSITETSLYEEVLTAAEILELYNEGKALDATTHSQADELKAYWRNNGLSTWTDLSTNSNDGVISGVTETLLCPQGVDGSRCSQGYIMNRARDTSSLNLDGVVYGQVSNSEDSFDFGTTAFTIQAWVKPNSLKADDRIVTKGTIGNGDFMISVGGDNTSLRVFAKDSGGAAIDSANVFSNLTLDTWQLITVVIDTPNDKILFYKDDGGVETKSGTFGGNFNNDNPITIATNSSLATTRFDGQIDGLLIYNKALSVAEKTKNYKATKGSHRN